MINSKSVNKKLNFNLNSISPQYIEFLQHTCLVMAKKSYKNGDIPVGAVIYDLKKQAIIATGYNTRESSNVITNHAEINAITEASKILNTWNLSNTLIISSLEPCLMCLGAIIESNIKYIFYGASNFTYNNQTTTKEIIKKLKKNTHIIIKGGILKAECEAIINDFFKNIRKSSK